ncbi:GlsB/YeaQ/YmgE family stress response membrane protein [Dictyobacter arantiisoli]|uniref:Transglycosylase n=1 Tax=Dictyobacter arantiisoli TaxID=2014874 RepID=A0A5A5TII2_9CHLR|nr:GlsB/YeaQ/YmgE family stress response membrane protein [Dictyobacter arantiisoli]GCF11132.1 hypothetical protein KDI_46960 [Dictyobacter arantiisoli]
MQLANHAIAIHGIHITEILQPGNIIAWLIVGLIAGALASTIVRGRGYGCIGNIIVGLVGSVIGAIIASALDLGTFHFCGSIFISFIGAAIFVAILQFLSGGR